MDSGSILVGVREFKSHPSHPVLPFSVTLENRIRPGFCEDPHPEGKPGLFVILFTVEKRILGSARAVGLLVAEGEPADQGIDRRISP